MMTLCWRHCSLRLWLTAELEGDPCPYSFGAGREILGQAGTLRGTQARCGTDTFACCVLGQSWSPNGFGKAFAKRWMPQTIEFSQGFDRISFQSAFLRWVFLLQFCLLSIEMGPQMLRSECVDMIFTRICEMRLCAADFFPKPVLYCFLQMF